jgi:hypothetical protein
VELLVDVAAMNRHRLGTQLLKRTHQYLGLENHWGDAVGD